MTNASYNVVLFLEETYNKMSDNSGDLNIYSLRGEVSTD